MFIIMVRKQGYCRRMGEAKTMKQEDNKRMKMVVYFKNSRETRMMMKFKDNRKMEMLINTEWTTHFQLLI